MTPRYKDFPNQPILSLSHTDHLTSRDFDQGGALIVGELGSGKTSSVSKSMIEKLMSPYTGKVILTRKEEL